MTINVNAIPNRTYIARRSKGCLGLSRFVCQRVILFLALVSVSLAQTPYRFEVSKVRLGMSQTEVVALTRSMRPVAFKLTP